MVKPECQDIDGQLQDARNDLATAQQDWLEAAPNSSYAGILKKEVARLTNLVGKLEGSLRDCEGLPPIPKPIRTLFTCTVIVGTNTPIFPSARVSNVPAAMAFSDIDYAFVQFTFPITPLGGVAGGVGPVTVTNVISANTHSTVTGAFERSTGHIDLQMARFDVHQSIAATENGTVDFMPLTTRTVPSPMAPGGVLTGRPLDRSLMPGRVILVGSSVLQGAVCLRGTSVDLIIDGPLSAFPPL